MLETISQIKVGNEVYNIEDTDARKKLVVATTTTDGLMSKDDKIKLEGISTDTQVNAVTSVNGETGAVNITLDTLGAAASNHTHTAAQVGAAASNHTHTAAQVGAAASNHSHTPESIGAAAANHTHTLTSLNAAAANHSHDAGNISSGRLNSARLPLPEMITLWSNGSESSTFDAQQLSGTNANLVAYPPRYIVIRFRSSNSTDTWAYGSQVLGLQSIADTTRYYGGEYADGSSLGYSSGGYYYGRARNESTPYASGFQYNTSTGYWYICFGDGYRSGTKGSKWCIPVAIIAVY